MGTKAAAHECSLHLTNWEKINELFKLAASACSGVRLCSCCGNVGSVLGGSQRRAQHVNTHWQLTGAILGVSPHKHSKPLLFM